jgi:hypothetical protein
MAEKAMALRIILEWAAVMMRQNTDIEPNCDSSQIVISNQLFNFAAPVASQHSARGFTDSLMTLGSPGISWRR